jgi:hypothetical protein
VLTPVRPSSYQLAEACGRAPWLAAKYREANALTTFGHAVDDQVSRGLAAGELVLAPGEELLPETAQILDWVRATFAESGVEFYVQRRVTLRDPETGEELTSGTPDLVALIRSQRRLVIVDWKKIGQWWAGHLAEPDNNLQQLIYGVASALEWALETPVDSFKIILACFDGHGVQPQESREILQAEWWDVIRRVKAVPRIDIDGPEPEATKGDHCQGCYQRMHCSAYLLPIMPALHELVPFQEPGELTNDAAVAALDWLERAGVVLRAAEKLRDLVKENVDAFTLSHGPIVSGEREYVATPTAGRRQGATVAELEKRGLTELIRPGKPGIKFGWREHTG